MIGCDAPTPSDSEDEMALPDALDPPSSSVNDLEPEDSPLVNDESELLNPRFGLDDRMPELQSWSFILQK